MNANKILILVCLFVSSSMLYSQTKSSSPGFDFRFRSAQADITSAIFVNTVSAGLDLDFVSFGKEAAAGVRLGGEYFMKGEVGGPIHGSPFLDGDLLARATVSAKFLRVDVCGGITYHSVSETFYSAYEGTFGKLTVDLKLNIYKNYAGVVLKYASSKEPYGGIGIFIGYEE